MAIKKAKYVYDENGKKTSLITPEQIDNREVYLKNYKGHLFCSEMGCDAQLDFVYFDSNSRKNFFRTHPHSKHSDSCPNRFESIASGTSKYGESLYAKLDDIAKRQILMGTYKKATNVNISDNGSNSKLGKKSIVVNKNNSSKEVTRFISTVDPNAEPVPDGKKRSPVKRKSCDTLTENDIGRTCAVYGEINNVDIGDTYVNINVLSESNGEFHFEFYTPFENNSKYEYNMLKNITKNYESSMKGDLITAIGLVEKRKDGYYLPVMDASSIIIDKKFISKYFLDKSNA